MSRSIKFVGQQSLSPKKKKGSRSRYRSNKAELLPGSQIRDEAVTGPPVVDGCRPPTWSKLSGFEKRRKKDSKLSSRERRDPYKCADGQFGVMALENGDRD